VGYSETAEVRRASGIVDELDLTPTDLAGICARADDYVDTLLHSTFKKGDKQYEAVRQASTLWATATVLDGFRDPDGKADKLRVSFYQIIAGLKKTAKFVVRGGKYQTDPLATAQTQDLVER
jgi:hypothetical protein